MNWFGMQISTYFAGFIDAVDQVLDLLSTHILEGLDALDGEELQHAHLAHVSPMVAVRRPRDVLRPVHEDLRRHIRRPRRECQVLVAQDLPGELRRRDDHCVRQA